VSSDFDSSNFINLSKFSLDKVELCLQLAVEVVSDLSQLRRHVYLQRHLLVFIVNLVVGEDNSERLSQDDVEKPEQEIVGVSTDLVLKLSLEDHARHVDHHQDEGNEVDYGEDSDDDVLVEDRGDCKGGQHARCAVDILSSEGVVDVTNEEVVDGVVPLAPVLAQVVGVPPVGVESAVRKLTQLRPEVQVGVEEAVEFDEPDVGRRHCHLERAHQNTELVASANGLQSLLSNGENVLHDQVDHDEVSDRELEESLHEVHD